MGSAIRSFLLLPIQTSGFCWSAIRQVYLNRYNRSNERKSQPFPLCHGKGLRAAHPRPARVPSCRDRTPDGRAARLREADCGWTDGALGALRDQGRVGRGAGKVWAAERASRAATRDAHHSRSAKRRGAGRASPGIAPGRQHGGGSWTGRAPGGASCPTPTSRPSHRRVRRDASYRCAGSVGQAARRRSAAHRNLVPVVGYRLRQGDEPASLLLELIRHDAAIEEDLEEPAVGIALGCVLQQWRGFQGRCHSGCHFSAPRNAACLRFVQVSRRDRQRATALESAVGPTVGRPASPLGEPFVLSQAYRPTSRQTSPTRRCAHAAWPTARQSGLRRARPQSAGPRACHQDRRSGAPAPQSRESSG